MLYNWTLYKTTMQANGRRSLLLVDLPEELIHLIFQYMTWRHIVACKRVCKKLRKALSTLNMFGTGSVNQNIYDTTLLYDARMEIGHGCYTLERSLRPLSVKRNSTLLHDITITFAPCWVWAIIWWLLHTSIKLYQLPITTRIAYPKTIEDLSFPLRYYLCPSCRTSIRRIARDCSMTVCASCCTDSGCQRHAKYAKRRNKKLQILQLCTSST
jgi:hypothetical protein